MGGGKKNGEEKVEGRGKRIHPLSINHRMLHNPVIAALERSLAWSHHSSCLRTQFKVVFLKNRNFVSTNLKKMINSNPNETRTGEVFSKCRCLCFGRRGLFDSGRVATASLCDNVVGVPDKPFRDRQSCFA